VLPDPRHAALVAATDLRRRWRATRDNSLQLVALAFVGVMYAVFAVGATVGGHAAGRALAAGDVDAPLTLARYGAAAVLVFPAFLVSFRTVNRVGSVSALDGLLTTVPHEDVAGGLLLAEAGWLVGVAIVPALLAVGALAVGAGSLPLAVAALVATLALLALGVVTGFALGAGGRVLLSRSSFFARHRSALGVAVFVAYMGLLTTDRIDSVVQPILEGVRRSPVGWFGDLALLPADAGASPTLAAAAAVGTPMVGAALVVAGTRFAGAFWYGDDARTDGESSGGTTERTGFGDLTLPGVPRASVRVAQKSWRRAARAPLKLSYVAYPLFGAVGLVSEALETGTVPGELPALVALYGAWATGAAFTLNPIGDEGAVLPVTLTTPVDGRTFVNGLLVAGVAVGTPVTALATLAAGLLGTSSLPAALATAAVGGALPVCVACVAAGAGTAFPRFEEMNITRSRTAVVPSLYAFALYSLVVLVAWVPVGVAAFAADPVAEVAGTGPTAVTAGGAAVTLLLAGAAGAVGYRYAVREFDAFRL
jgi:hypothetical protein